jgi:hypothetical protein
MLRVCFFPLPQGGRRDEWAGADRTNGGDNPAAAKSIDLRKRPIRRLGSSDCSSRCQSGSRAMTRHTKYIVVQPVFESIVGTQYSD